jgi:hypothetical protein
VYPRFRVSRSEKSSGRNTRRCSRAARAGPETPSADPRGKKTPWLGQSLSVAELTQTAVADDEPVALGREEDTPALDSP